MTPEEGPPVRIPQQATARVTQGKPWGSDDPGSILDSTVYGCVASGYSFCFSESLALLSDRGIAIPSLLQVWKN